MEEIEIPEDQVRHIEEIAPGLCGLKVAFVNVYGVSHADGSWTLIDAAIPLSAWRIKHWAEKTFGRPPNAIVLSHGHFDHVSASRDLAEAWNIPIYAHPLEFPHLNGTEDYTVPDWTAAGGVTSFVSQTLARGPIDVGPWLRALPADGAELSLEELPGWTLMHTPGHTPGHVSFFRESDRTLIVGDAFCTCKPESFFEVFIAQHPELHGPPPFFTADWEEAKKSVQKLAALQPRTVASGHGRPISGEGVAAELKMLAQKFEQIGIPADMRKPSHAS